jgi:peptidoglycan/xylan/chitin deacetylase (PgdA/CDA1 family)
MKTRILRFLLEICLILIVSALSLKGQGAALHRNTVVKGEDSARVTAHATALVVEHGLRTVNEIALTFDACSTPKPGGYDDRVTSVLIETETPATIFLGGKWMLDQQEHTKLLASLPQFELGNHTYLHPHLTEVSDQRIRSELQKTQDILVKLTGKRANLFRPPYGEYNERVVRIASELGLTTVEYDLPSGDPDTMASKQRLIEWVIRKARAGSIIVMHINKRGWHTAEALPEIITRLRARGFTFVTVSKLINDAELARPRP